MLSRAVNYRIVGCRRAGNAAYRPYSFMRTSRYKPSHPYIYPGHEKVTATPMVYISGEEMTRYGMELILEHWIRPHLDISRWEMYDLSCKVRDDTDDQVLVDAVEAGARICAIFKEPTITPSAKQVKEFGLKRPLSSPNGIMRRGWNGISISRDTIHIPDVELGYQKPVFFDRHAVGGEYGAGWKQVGAGRLLTLFFPDDGSSPVFVDDRVLSDNENVAVTYHNPLDNVPQMAHHFFSRCLEAKVVPYVVTKKTVFKWQEGFWVKMKEVFDEHYSAKFKEAGIIPDGKLEHLISDAATMQIIRWTKGGFGMAAHNYDGDMLTDEIAQVHRSPGFITSNLVGRTADGRVIREFEASHGTVTDLYHAHLRGEETSLNPLGLTEALIGAIEHSARLYDGKDKQSANAVLKFTSHLRRAVYNTFRYGQGTRDMAGPKGLTTEQFVQKVAWRLCRYLAAEEDEEVMDGVVSPDRRFQKNYNVDREALESLFKEYDTDNSGKIGKEELEKVLVKLGVAPLKHPEKKFSAAEGSREVDENNEDSSDGEEGTAQN